MALALFEFLLMIGVLFTFMTQVILPIYNGTKLFPFFKSKSEIAKVKEELEHDIEEVVELINLKQTVKELENKANE